MKYTVFTNTIKTTKTMSKKTIFITLAIIIAFAACNTKQTAETEPNEYAEFNINGTLIPLGKVQTMQIDEIEDLKEEEIIVYCRSGNRSGQACMFLDAMGFTNTKNLVGGMLEWQEKFGAK